MALRIWRTAMSVQQMKIVNMGIDRIRTAVNPCNPADLSFRAPLDEYEEEIDAIARRLEFRSNIVTYGEWVAIAWRVFTETV